METKPKTFLLSIVVPVYNEALGLKHFHDSLVEVCEAADYKYEIIYVDDGSSDSTADILKQLAGSNVKPLYLSRNFGKEQATTAGLHNAHGDAVVILDGDGQHPVELIPEFVSRWQNGKQVVVGIRTANKREGFVKKIGSKLFYKMLRVLGVPDIMPGTTDFRLVDRQVVAAFNKLNEHNRVARALIDWLGFERDYIHFTAKERAHGTATYSVRKLIQLAINGFVSLSFTPLYLSGYMGMFITALSFVASLFAIVEKYILNDPLNLNLTGPAILGILLLFLVGILLIGQGLIAVYVARIYTEVQGRPLYILKD